MGDRGFAGRDLQLAHEVWWARALKADAVEVDRGGERASEAYGRRGVFDDVIQNQLAAHHKHQSTPTGAGTLRRSDRIGRVVFERCRTSRATGLYTH